jgi:glutathione peroxidase
MTDLLDLPVTTLDGDRTTFGDLTRGKVTLVVNVASKCGLTPQYEKLEALQRELGGANFTVLGFPCNQFGGQEPGGPEEIATFCSSTYGVTFPLTAKIDVNGDSRDPVYRVLTETPDAEGEAGDIQWNFEKFVVGPDGAVLARFRPLVEPDAPEVLDCLKAALPGTAA